MRAWRWSAVSLRTKGLLVVALPVLPLACFWGIVTIAMLRQSPAANTTERNLEIQADLARVFSALLDADAGARDNVLTGNAGALARYRAALGRLAQTLVDLDRLIIDHDLRDALGRLHDLVYKELDVLAPLMRPSQIGANDRASLDRSVVILDQIRAVTATIEERQVGLAAERTAQNQRRARGVFVLLLAGSVLCTGGGVIAALVLARGISRRHAALSYNVGRLVRGEDPEPLPEGDPETAWLDAHFRTAAYQLRERERDLRQVVERLNLTNQALRARGVELERANRELESFGYSVSHDLRAPLRTIDGFSQAIEEDCGDQLGEASRNSLERVRAAATRMGVLIDDLLALARITRMDLSREPMDLSATVAAVAADLSQRAPERPVEVQIAEGITAKADPGMIRIAFENLLENAFKYTGRVEQPRIEFGAVRNGVGLVYHVKDNGAGFDMRYADKLFSAFQRLHSDREFSGTGIGLATVQRIVHRHGGRIWAEGAVGSGATFYFTLEPEEAP
jgi:signal transduction histidine kinase